MALIHSLFNNQFAENIFAAVHIVVYCLLIAILLYEASGTRVNWGRSALYSILVAITIIAQKSAAVAIFIKMGASMNTWYGMVIYSALMFREPLWLAVCALLTILILKLPWKIIIKQLAVLFFIFQIAAGISSIADLLFWCVTYIFNIDQALINANFHISGEIIAVMGTLFIIVSGYFARRFIKENRYKIKLVEEMHNENMIRTTMLNIAQVLALWLFVVLSGLTNQLRDDVLTGIIQIVYCIAIVILCIIMIYLNYSRKLKDIQSRQLADTNKMMLESIDNFRGIKHDFNNILQTYEGYFALEDFEGLKNYHQMLFGKTVAAGGSLTLLKTFAEKPAILGIILSTSNHAKKMNVDFMPSRMEFLKNINMSEFDLCRILGILLNNAVEHAAETKARLVSFSTQDQPGGKAVIVISNSVDSKISIGDIFKEGYTTKTGHSGHGLAEVSRELKEYPECTIMPSCTGDTFTMMFYVPLLKKIEKAKKPQ